jgi:hypothetical protein
MWKDAIVKTILGVVGMAVIVAGLSVSPVYGDASENGCEHSQGRAAGCSNDPNKPTANVPEPGTLALVVAGIIGLGGAAYLLTRKRMLQN